MNQYRFGTSLAVAAFLCAHVLAGEVVVRVGPGEGGGFIVRVGPAAKGEPGPVPAPKGPEDKPGDEKLKGPDHNVTLNEEPGVADLLNKACKARERAEKDAQVWPECVKLYGDLLRKYGQTVYLDRWEGDGMEKASQYKNGLYKSTRDRVAHDIAGLPPAGLAIYRVVNDPIARALYAEAQEQFSERKMEQVAREHFATSWSDAALVWLGEAAYNRGALRQAINRFSQISAVPPKEISKQAVLARVLLAQVQAGDRAGAEVSLKALQESPELAELRIGHDQGAAALEKLKKRMTGLAAAARVKPAGEDRGWETYFGNAAHNRVPAGRANTGVLKFSLPINRLLYNSDKEPARKAPENAVVRMQENVAAPELLSQHLTGRGGYFYLCSRDVAAAYPVNNPRPGPPPAGNAKFLWPGESAAPQSSGAGRQRFGGEMAAEAVRNHPYFCTLGGERLFVAIGPEPPIADPNMGMMGNPAENKSNPNALAALGAQTGKLLWSLQQDSAAFQSQSKADQEWLKTVYFSSAPAYEAGMLYVLAVVPGGSCEAWAAAFDAESGHLEWRRLICAGNPVQMSGRVLPDLGAPVAVANGKVFAVTNLGAVAALDAGSGAVCWIRIYDRHSDPVNPWEMRMRPSSLWGPNPPVVQGNALIVTPQDSDMLYCLDTETGARQWEVPRVMNANGEETLKHVLGVVQGAVAVSGSQLHFFKLAGGSLAADAILPEHRIKGRGMVVEDGVLLPTEKALLRIELKRDGKKYTARVRDSQPWQDPSAEAGHVFLAGDVLYTVSSTHVNAYFDPADLERKLRERIAQAPGEPGNYIELADVYAQMRPEPRLADALKEIETGLKLAGEQRNDPKAAAAIPVLLSRKFDALMKLGGSAADPAAAGFYREALAVSLQPAMPAEAPVTALQALAENLAARQDAAGAVKLYQRILAGHGEVLFAGQRAAGKARFLAQSRIEELKKRNPQCYAAVEAEAAQALAEAGSDAGKLEAVLKLYPNAETAAAALLKLAEAALEARPDQARVYAQRFLRGSRNSPDATVAEALLASACERARLLDAAQEQLVRLATGPEFAQKTLNFDPADPQTRLAAPVLVAEWARKRLAQPQYQRPVSAAVWSMGSGKLKEMWSKPAPAKSQVLAIQGLWPASQRRTLFYMEGQELAAISAADGSEAWTPRPKLPAGASPNAWWSGQLLLVCGEKELVAFDAADGGKAAWRRPHPPASGFWSAVAAGDQRVAAAYPNGLLSILDSASGNELWSRMIEGGQWYGVPAVDGGFVVVMAQVPPKLFIFDLETGAERNATGIPDGLIVEPRAAGGRVYYADKNNMLHALDGATGKLLWKHPCGGVVTQLYAARHLVVAVLDRKKVIAVDPHGEGVRKPWSPLLPADASVIGVRADGEDLYVSYVQQNKACVDAYSIPAQGKRLWTADVSSEPGSLDLAPDYLASEHLALTMSNFDPLGAKAAVVVLADRKTGKLVWDTALSSEGRNIPNDNGVPPYSVRLFDGGVVVTENLKRTAYAAAGAGAGKADIQDLKTKLAAAPEDAALCIKLACAQYEQGEGSEALGTLSAALAAGGLADDKFTAVCGTLARLRKDFAQKNKFVFEFRKTEQAPALDGTTASWAAFPETVLEGWRNVYLASEEDPAPGVQKALWKGAGDLKAAFRGAYDDKHLYLMWVVTDDRQVNEQVSGNHCDLGDSVKVVFDIDRDGGRGYRGKDFELGLALGKEGKTLFHRWVENGRYIGANPPLDAAAKAVRNEADRQTVYQLALPLAHLGLTAEAGRRFGFSFAVNDQDDGSSVEKSMAASPGVIKPPYPGLFAEGVLQGK